MFVTTEPSQSARRASVHLPLALLPGEGFLGRMRRSLNSEPRRSKGKLHRGPYGLQRVVKFGSGPGYSCLESWTTHDGHLQLDR